MIDGGRRGEAFLREDGSFSIAAPAGSYLIEVINPDYRFEPFRVDITAKGKIRARMVNNLQPSQVTLVRIIQINLSVALKSIPPVNKLLCYQSYV